MGEAYQNNIARTSILRRGGALGELLGSSKRSQAPDREESVLVSLLVLIESEWVLRSRYEFEREAILGMFRALLGARELSFEDEPAVEEALFHWKDSVCGFTDCLITAHNRQLGCRATATFDAKAARVPGALPL